MRWWIRMHRTLWLCALCNICPFKWVGLGIDPAWYPLQAVDSACVAHVAGLQQAQAGAYISRGIADGLKHTLAMPPAQAPGAKTSAAPSKPEKGPWHEPLMAQARAVSAPGRRVCAQWLAAAAGVPGAQGCSYERRNGVACNMQHGLQPEQALPRARRDGVVGFEAAGPAV